MKFEELTVEQKLRLICGKDNWHTEDFSGTLPSVTMADASMGVRMPKPDQSGDKPSVAYPALQVLANTWNKDLAREYASARVAVLPSLEDHWGVVVHEAALCGCALLLSSEVGAAEDLYSRKNGRVFSPVRNDCMIKALKDLDEWSDEEWAAAFEESQRQASMISPENFSKNLSGLITQLEHDLDAK